MKCPTDPELMVDINHYASLPLAAHRDRSNRDHGNQLVSMEGSHPVEC